MSRRSFDDFLELRFLIPTKAAGVIIGKGGETVKNLRDKLELKINIPDSSGPERVLQLNGKSKSVFEALELILQKAEDCFPASEAEVYSLNYRPKRRQARHQPVTSSHNVYSAEEYSSESVGNGGAGLGAGEAPTTTTISSSGMDDCPTSPNGGVDVRLLVHQSLAGGIIGRGGERIRELREQVNLKILKLFQSVCPQSTDRVVQMAGEIGRVLECIRAVSEILQASQSRGAEHPYDARNFEEVQAICYGGWLSKYQFRNLLTNGPTQALTAAAALWGGCGGVSANLALHHAHFQQQQQQPVGAQIHSSLAHHQHAAPHQQSPQVPMSMMSAVGMAAVAAARSANFVSPDGRCFGVAPGSGCAGTSGLHRVASLGAGISGGLQGAGGNSASSSSGFLTRSGLHYDSSNAVTASSMMMMMAAGGGHSSNYNQSALSRGDLTHQLAAQQQHQALNLAPGPGGDLSSRIIKTVQVSVPNMYLGAIMGRGGTRIRIIRQQSGAEIRVYEADKSGADRIIDITGTQQQISYAQQLLKNSVLMYHDKR